MNIKKAGYRNRATPEVISAVVIVLVLGATPGAHATTLATEDFTYPNGSINGQNGGEGWASGWTSNDAVVDGELVTTDNVPTFRELASPITHSSGTSVFVAFDLSADPSGNNDFAGFSFYNDTNEEIFFGMTFNTDAYGINWSGAYNGDSGFATTTTPQRIVGEIVFGSSTTTANLYIDPGATLGSPDDSFTGTTGSLGGSWNTVRLHSGSTDGFIGTYDNLAIGTNFAAVQPVPEPSQVVLFALGLAGIGLTLRQRRRQPSKATNTPNQE